MLKICAKCGTRATQSIRSQHCWDCATYKYAPQVGDVVKLRHFHLYAHYGIEHVWAGLKVEHLTGDAEALVRVMSGPTETEQILTVALYNIEPPTYWAETYDIHAGPDKIREVLSWLPRGIGVKGAAALEMAGTVSYFPADRAAEPRDWKFAGKIDDIVPPDQVKDRIRVILLERQHDYALPTPCTYCGGTGLRTAEKVHLHIKGVTEIGQKFPCWTCNNGLAKLSISDVPKNKRAFLKEWLAERGWKLSHCHYPGEGIVWTRTRETVIKELGKDPKEELLRARGVA